MTTSSSEQAEIAAQTPPPANPPAPSPVEQSGGLPPLTDTPLEKLDEMIARLGMDGPTPGTTPSHAEPEPTDEPDQTEGAKPPYETERSRVLPNRVTTAQFSDIEQEAIALGKIFRDAGEDVPTLRERIELVEQRQAEAIRANPPPPDPDTELAEIEAELAEATASEDELARSLGVDELLSKQKRISELAAMKRQITDALAQAQADGEANFRAERLQVIDQAKGMFPDSKDPETELGQEIQGLISEIRETPNHPNRAVLSTKDAPLFVAQTAATRVAHRRAAEKGTTVALEYSALMNSAPAYRETAAPQQGQRRVTPAGGAASAPFANAPARKALDLSSPDSFNLATIESILPTQRSNGYVLRH